MALVELPPGTFPLSRPTRRAPFPRGYAQGADGSVRGTPGDARRSHRQLVTDRTGLDRAMAALRMYDAREAIEEIEDALVRLDTSDHGSCGSCGRPIPFVHLDTIAQAGFCAACLTPMGYSADRLTAPRRRPISPQQARAVHIGRHSCHPATRSTSGAATTTSRADRPWTGPRHPATGPAERARWHGRSSSSRPRRKSRPRHPSSARHDEERHETTCPACGSTSTTPGDAAEAVRRLRRARPPATSWRFGPGAPAPLWPSDDVRLVAVGGRRAPARRAPCHRKPRRSVWCRRAPDRRSGSDRSTDRRQLGTRARTALVPARHGGRPADRPARTAYAS